MDGSLAPLKELCELAHKYQAYLIVDEAHAVGMYGKNGRGVVAEHQLSSKVFAQITTFGKALGVHGAIVLGSHDLKQILINFATSYLYTTALPFYALAAIQSSYQLFPRMISERAHLQQLIQIFRTSIPFASSTHIQSLPIPGNENVKRHSELLFKQGFDVRPIMSPTVRRGHEMLRVCLHVFNQEDHLNQLLRAISNA
jgi:8-amino-7-oxononanoate synthase